VRHRGKRIVRKETIHQYLTVIQKREQGDREWGGMSIHAKLSGVDGMGKMKEKD